jgi:four helix bundle protein
MTQYNKYTGNSTLTFTKLYGYKNLLAWQAADELAKAIHDLVIHFHVRYYKLANQMLGSASSAKSNIAEGYCRNSPGDYIRFCEIARGSLGELGSQIQDCERWNIVSQPDLQRLIHLYGDTTFFLEQLIKGLRAKRDAGDWDRSLHAKEERAEYMSDDASQPFMLPDDQTTTE